MSALFAAVFFCAGCGENLPPAPSVFPVSGTVTIDGQPLATGSITFDPSDGKSIASGGGITDGKFSFESTAGPKVVRITSTKETGEKDEYGSLISVELVAIEFNADSTLTTEVKPSENTGLTFDVKAAATE